MASSPFPVRSFGGRNAISQLEALRETGRAEGFFPVLLGSPDEADVIWENREELAVSPSEVVAEGSSLDASRWLAERSSTDEEYYGDVEIGEWPEGPADPNALIAHLDVLSGEPKPEVLIALVPAARPWEIPAHLGIGGWNECPRPEEHVGMARHWHERYGAVVVAATNDIVQYAVERPPATRDEAMALAREQFIYCPDLVYQGTETLSGLAASLVGSRYWYFWWD